MKTYFLTMVDIENFFENIVSKNITVKISKKTLKYFKNLKYDVKLNDIITVPIEHLPLGSNQKILVKCTNCCEIINIIYNNYVNIMKKGNNYICKKCNTFQKNALNKQIQKEKNLTKQQYCLQDGFNYIFITNKNYFEFTKIIENYV